MNDDMIGDDVLDNLLFGSGLDQLQFDDDSQNQIAFGTDNTMQLQVNQNIYQNNPELNVPFRWVLTLSESELFFLKNLCGQQV